MNKLITNGDKVLDLELATLGDRIVAFLIDLFFMIVYAFVVAVMVPLLGYEDDLYYKLLFPLIFYSLLFEFLRNGQSPGKKFRKISVMKLDGTPPGFGNLLLRWMLRFVDIFSFYGILGMLVIANSKNNQRIGDMLAGTCVIKMRTDEKDSLIGRTPDGRVRIESVLRLNDEMVAQLNIAIKMYKEENEDISLLVDKLKVELNVVSDLSDIEFLNAVVEDYVDSTNDEDDK